MIRKGVTAREYATPDGEHRVALIGLLPPVRSPARRDALLLGPRATSDELPDALKSGETAVAGEVSVPIATDEGSPWTTCSSLAGRSMDARSPQRSSRRGHRAGSCP